MPASAEPTSRRDWQEIFALLDSALELGAAEQRAWLDGLSPEQARLSPMLKKLLLAHADIGTGDFMRAPASFSLPTDLAPPGLTANPSSARTDCCARLARAAWPASGSRTGRTACSSARSR